MNEPTDAAVASTPEAGSAPGARLLEDGRCRFRVWAPRAERVELLIEKPVRRTLTLSPEPRGYFGVDADDVAPGTRYRYRLDGELERPDPASLSQPDGVHGASEVIALDYDFADGAWRGHALEDYVLYELHVGTFTRSGTFDGVIGELPRLRELGITAIELMPVAQFPGERNWGYDGVLPYAVQNSYGGVRGLQRLVDACHAQGIAVVLDVVYNHLGPEGNYLHDFGPYFTDAYHTPWGKALNFDRAGSDEVRRYFIDNALAWVGDFHIDALRLDAVHAIVDSSALPFLEQLSAEVHALAEGSGRRVHVIAESDRNDPRTVKPREAGGMGLDAMWADDFHHALHALVTRERDGYYADFGRIDDLARAWRDGLTFTGQYSAYRGRRHGRSPAGLAAERFLVCAQNHDQVGNRMRGERLSALCDLESQKLAAACVLLAPHLPLLFMGEEYGELAPFQYFVHHGDPELVRAVRQGRAAEFSAFGWRGEVPDPQAPETFERSRLDLTLRGRSPHAELERFYRRLITLRRELSRGPLAVRVDEAAGRLEVHSRDAGRPGSHWLLCSFAETTATLQAVPPAPGRFTLRLCSADREWAGPGASMPNTLQQPTPVELSPRSCALYVRESP